MAELHEAVREGMVPELQEAVREGMMPEPPAEGHPQAAYVPLADPGGSAG